MQPKTISCYHCGKKLVVARRAISIVCPYCNKHLSIEDQVIESHYNMNRIETCGSLRVEQGCNVRARVQVHNLEVQGRVQGDVTAHNKITVESGAHLNGDITAPRLEVNNGGMINGFCRIEPQGQ